MSAKSEFRVASVTVEDNAMAFMRADVNDDSKAEKNGEKNKNI